MNNETIKDTFHPRDVFDPDSIYNKIRARYIPEAKRRGQFYSWEAGAMAENRLVGAGKLVASKERPADRDIVPSLVLFSEDPTRVIGATMKAAIRRLGPTSRKLVLHLQIPSKTDQPAVGTRCRAFLFTRGVVERLCGPSALQSDQWLLSALRHLFETEENDEDLKVSSTLAAIAEFDGVFEEKEECLFPPFDLPRQATTFHARDTIFVIMIEGINR